MHCHPTVHWDRNFSPTEVSAKREFLRLSLETFWIFSLKLPNFSVGRPAQTASNLLKMQDFCKRIDHNQRSSDWLAGAGGIEL
jgi:hypothetical protein